MMTSLTQSCSAFAAGSAFLLLSSCDGSSPLGAGISEPSSESATAFLCRLVSQNLHDLSGDTKISSGDKLTVVIEVSKAKDCSTTDGSLFGSKELVSVNQEKDGNTRFLTLSQYTLQLDNGRLQSRGKDSVSFPTELLNRIQSQGAEEVHQFELQELQREKVSFAVQGFDGRFTGMVGTAELLPGAPAEFKARLSPLAAKR